MNVPIDGLAFYRSMFDPRRSSTRGVDRASLPSPHRYLAQEGLLIGKPRGEWAKIACPVHKGGSEVHPSMNVSLVDGHFRCHACGAKGGDVIALHMLRAGLRFRDAVHDLGGRFNDK